MYITDGPGFEVFLGNGPDDESDLLRSYIFVGVSSPRNDDQFGNKRMAELLLGVDQSRFNAFDEFVIKEVIPQVEGDVSPAERLAVGWSNGGSWALNMALRHPKLFAGAISISTAQWSASGQSHGLPTKLWLGGGLLEREFQVDQIGYVAELPRLGFVVHTDFVNGGHSPATWNAIFWWALGEDAGQRILQSPTPPSIKQTASAK